MTKSTPRIAIVCDWLYGGGAEKVVEQLHRMYPDAPIYTSYCSDEWRTRLDGKVVTGYLQHWPFAQARKFLPLLRQWWFRRLDLSAYDIVISCTGNGEAKFARAPAGGKHICYCFTPPHFYWRKYNEYLHEPGMGTLNPIARLGLKLLVKPLRQRDYQAAQDIDEFVGISKHIQSDIKKFYGRDSVLIHPPVEVSEVKLETRPVGSAKELRAVYWGRHVPYKRIDLIIAACNELQIPLTIVGKGPETSRLKHIAGPTVSFTGFVPDEKMPELASKANLFIFPSEEDFGIAPVEALAFGLPVLAYGRGGALDYVIPGKTGELFDKQSINSLTTALTSFKPSKYSTKTLQNTAKSFSPQTFQKKVEGMVDKS